MALNLKSMQVEVVSNQQVQPGFFDLELRAPEIAALAQPGQFLMIRPNDTRDPLLGRPLGIYDWDKAKGTINLLYAVKGDGTKRLAQSEPGDMLPVVAPLGRGYEFLAQDKKVAVVAGGVGVAPLYPVIKYLLQNETKVEILLGASTAVNVLSMEKLGNLGCEITVFTDDGSMGTKGYPTQGLADLLKNNDIDRVYTCGPMIMMENVAKLAEAAGVPCQVSLEERMGCGIGICMGCVCPHKNEDGSRNLVRICYEGPVFDSKEVIWHG